MTAARFVVHELFDIAARPGVLVVGRVDGVVKAGMRLADGQEVEATVLALEFLTPKSQQDGTVTLLLPRDSGLDLRQGAVLMVVGPA